eukprot:TRINITY_DN21992_c0_g1_i1.p1 TRINITY_DN21992_c0_g1~~TRINITY_DN21992_c0_g1_i1.p1  ORF type:complete len:441 (-),score=34.26 TRINITY_DN21992_c0_g1_i1:50-1372(-)
MCMVNQRRVTLCLDFLVPAPKSAYEYIEFSAPWEPICDETRHDVVHEEYSWMIRLVARTVARSVCLLRAVMPRLVLYVSLVARFIVGGIEFCIQRPAFNLDRCPAGPGSACEAFRVPSIKPSSVTLCINDFLRIVSVVRGNFVAGDTCYSCGSSCASLCPVHAIEDDKRRLRAPVACDRLAVHVNRTSEGDISLACLARDSGSNAACDSVCVPSYERSMLELTSGETLGLYADSSRLLCTFDDRSLPFYQWSLIHQRFWKGRASKLDKMSDSKLLKLFASVKLQVYVFTARRFEYGLPSHDDYCTCFVCYDVMKRYRAQQDAKRDTNDLLKGDFQNLHTSVVNLKFNVYSFKRPCDAACSYSPVPACQISEQVHARCQTFDSEKHLLTGNLACLNSGNRVFDCPVSGLPSAKAVAPLNGDVTSAAGLPSPFVFSAKAFGV